MGFVLPACFRSFDVVWAYGRGPGSRPGFLIWLGGFGTVGLVGIEGAGS